MEPAMQDLEEGRRPAKKSEQQRSQAPVVLHPDARGALESKRKSISVMPQDWRWL